MAARAAMMYFVVAAFLISLQGLRLGAGVVDGAELTEHKDAAAAANDDGAAADEGAQEGEEGEAGDREQAQGTAEKDGAAQSRLLASSSREKRNKDKDSIGVKSFEAAEDTGKADPGPAGAPGLLEQMINGISTLSTTFEAIFALWLPTKPATDPKYRGIEDPDTAEDGMAPAPPPGTVEEEETAPDAANDVEPDSGQKDQKQTAEEAEDVEPDK
eukprot:gnl/TRDRNA2_/TRDRNA2_41741_c0_seq1.p1 gnl/TRDRNA2_/TRDRNA2_41741_c0~~gnl/TRDRNA2_/TRDRNA2_41741_c0_seq1.p1  ORF type:complete len:215 (+),score=55.20 gnl/TRDRNA2_/TRDRNA2_41741_c0_seq1:128-772(+)